MESDRSLDSVHAPSSAEGEGSGAGWIYTDSHAHLEMVAERLGEATTAEVLGRYDASRGGPAGPGLPVLPGEAAGHGPLLLDPGVEPEDLLRRARLAARLLELARKGAAAPESGPPADGRPAAGGPGGSPVAEGSALPPLPSWLRHAAGIWPGRPALDDPESSLAALESSIAEAARRGLRVAAIGECGLDFHHMEAEEERQRLLFRLQIGLARRLGLPLIVHTRDAAAATLEEIGEAPSSIPVIIHCYGYGVEEARAFLAKGCFLSFAGNLSYKKSEPLREALRLVPRERLLLETDAPYMNPEPRRGKASSPLDVERSYRVAAGLRAWGLEELAASVSLIAWDLFGPRPRP